MAIQLRRLHNTAHDQRVVRPILQEVLVVLEAQLGDDVFVSDLGQAWVVTQQATLEVNLSVLMPIANMTDLFLRDLPSICAADIEPTLHRIFVQLWPLVEAELRMPECAKQGELVFHAVSGAADSISILAGMHHFFLLILAELFAKQDLMSQLALLVHDMVAKLLIALLPDQLEEQSTAGDRTPRALTGLARRLRSRRLPALPWRVVSRTVRRVERHVCLDRLVDI